ncbi:MAG: UDP-glucose 4-epimerase [Crocinitomicaceae bacterium]|nr:UDP-glucose 4-epimerase [Crocinitomicaceae bacterium]
MFKGKKILITGGTGSFGRTILSSFLKSNINEIRILSRDEKKQDQMRNTILSDKVKFYIGDVRDKDSIENAIAGVDYIFHAAALKQVPSCEFFPMEAYKTNTIGTLNTIDVAIKKKVKKIVILSTDKAVYPINAMGMSKAMSEKVALSKSAQLTKKETIIVITRYGNVMSSRGSVIPLFLNQIQNNKMLTVTDPNMTRFLMSLNESVDLVKYAFKFGKQGDIFVQKSPAATIGDLAIAMLEIFNLKNRFKIIGTRHSEKLFETLIAREEMVRVKNYKKYFCIKADNRNLNYQNFFTEGEKKISASEDYTSHNTRRMKKNELIKVLRENIKNIDINNI